MKKSLFMLFVFLLAGCVKEVPQDRFVEPDFEHDIYEGDEYFFHFNKSPKSVTMVKYFDGKVIDGNKFTDCQIVKNEKGYMVYECQTQEKGGNQPEKSYNRLEVKITDTGPVGFSLDYKEMDMVEIKRINEKGEVHTYNVFLPKEESFLPDNWFYKMFPFLYTVPQDRFVDERFNQRLRPFSRVSGYHELTPTKITGEYTTKEGETIYSLYTDCHLLANRKGYLMYECQKQNIDYYCESIKECEEKQENEPEYLEFKIIKYEEMLKAWEVRLKYYKELYHTVFGEYVVLSVPEEEGAK